MCVNWQYSGCTCTGDESISVSVISQKLVRFFEMPQEPRKGDISKTFPKHFWEITQTPLGFSPFTLVNLEIGPYYPTFIPVQYIHVLTSQR